MANIFDYANFCKPEIYHKQMKKAKNTKLTENYSSYYKSEFLQYTKYSYKLIEKGQGNDLEKMNIR